MSVFLPLMFFVVIIFMVHPADTPVLHTDVSV